MSIISELVLFKDLENLPWGWVPGGGWGVLVEASSVIAGEEGGNQLLLPWLLVIDRRTHGLGLVERLNMELTNFLQVLGSGQCLGHVI